jgi:hypothetical protein
MSKKARDRAALLAGVANHPELLAGAAGGEGFRTNTELLSALEGMRIISLPEVARLNDLSVDTIRRRFPHLILKLSDKRVGMRLRDALSLATPLTAA